MSSLMLINNEFRDLCENPIASIGVCVGMPNKNNPYVHMNGDVL